MGKVVKEPDEAEELLNFEAHLNQVVREQEHDYKNREALMFIKMLVTDETLSQVWDVKDACIVWKWLWEMHGTSDKGRAFYLKNTLFSLQMEGGESI
jgi:hypothetical protein